MAEKKGAPQQEESKTTAIAVPDYLKGVQAPSSGAMSSGVGISVPRVSAKGKQFRFINGDDEVKLNLGEAAKVVILGIEPQHGLAKTFYKDGYTPGSADPPDCSSWDGIRPDSWINPPQYHNCAECPNNAWGSATSMSGKKAKACKESKRLIVARADDPEGAYYILTVTVSSLKALSTYGQELDKNGWPYSAVITKVSFADSDFPQFEFTFDSFLPEVEGKACISRAIGREWDGIVSSRPQLGDGAEPQRALPMRPAHEAPPAPAAGASSTAELLKKW